MGLSFLLGVLIQSPEMEVLAFRVHGDEASFLGTHLIAANQNGCAILSRMSLGTSRKRGYEDRDEPPCNPKNQMSELTIFLLFM